MQDRFAKVIRFVTYVAGTVIVALIAVAIIAFLVALIGKILAW